VILRMHALGIRDADASSPNTGTTGRPGYVRADVGGGALDQRQLLTPAAIGGSLDVRGVFHTHLAKLPM
jgi:hypothetical protein